MSFWSAAGDSPRVARPSLGFMLGDEEMVGRLAHLYGTERAEAMGRAWASLREHGCGHLVDREKECYCRRMYELMLGCPWEDVRLKLESAYADRLPDSLTPEALKEMLDDYDDEDGNPVPGGGVYRGRCGVAGRSGGNCRSRFGRRRDERADFVKTGMVNQDQGTVPA